MGRWAEVGECGQVLVSGECERSTLFFNSDKSKWK